MGSNMTAPSRTFGGPGGASGAGPGCRAMLTANGGQPRGGIRKSRKMRLNSMSSFYLRKKQRKPLCLKGGQRAREGSRTPRAPRTPPHRRPEGGQSEGTRGQGGQI